MVESKVVRGNIAPIQASQLRLGDLHLQVPVDVPGVFCPERQGGDPNKVTATRQHARACAQRLVDSLGHLPHTPEAGDILAMAFTILDLVKETP